VANYAASFGKNSSQYASFPIIVADNPGGTNVSWSLETRQKGLPGEDLYLATNDADYWILRSYGDVVYNRSSLASTWGGAVATPDDWNTLRLELTWTGGTKQAELFVNGISKGFQTLGAASPIQFTRIAKLGTSYHNQDVDYFTYIDHNNAANNRSYLFDDGAGTVATDSSGNAQNGTLVNGPTWVLLSGGGSTVTLTLNDVATDSAIDPLTVAKTTTLALNDVACVPAIDPLTVAKTTTLVLNDVACVPAIDSVAVTTASNTVDLTLNDVACQPAIDPVTCSATRSLALNGVACQPAIGGSTVTKTTSLALNGVACQPAIDFITINRAVILTLNKVATIPAIDAFTATVTNVLTVNAVAVVPAIAPITVTKQTTLQLTDLAVITAIGPITVIAASDLRYVDTSALSVSNLTAPRTIEIISKPIAVARKTTVISAIRISKDYLIRII